MDYQRTAELVREHVKRSTGLPMTVAFARSRTLAKLLGDTAKPFGAIAVTDQDHETELLGKLPVAEIAGIGRRRAGRVVDPCTLYGWLVCNVERLIEELEFHEVRAVGGGWAVRAVRGAAGGMDGRWCGMAMCGGGDGIETP